MSTALEVTSTQTAQHISSELGFWSAGIHEMKKAFGGGANPKDHKSIQITSAEEEYEQKMIESRKS